MACSALPWLLPYKLYFFLSLYHCTCFHRRSSSLTDVSHLPATGGDSAVNLFLEASSSSDLFPSDTIPESLLGSSSTAIDCSPSKKPESVLGASSITTTVWPTETPESPSAVIGGLPSEIPKSVVGAPLTAVGHFLEYHRGFSANSKSLLWWAFWIIRPTPSILISWLISYDPPGCLVMVCSNGPGVNVSTWKL